MKTEKIKTKAPYPELRGKLAAMSYPALSEIKYDGEYSLIVFHDDGDKIDCKTVNKYGKTRTHFPAIDRISEQCRQANVKEAVFLAELYTDEGKLGALYDLLGRKEDDSLNLSVFDIEHLVYEDGSNVDDIVSSDELIDRRETLMSVLPDQHTNMEICSNQTEAIYHFERIVSLGYEGTVLKSLSGPLIMGPCPWVKQKYKDQTNYPIVLIDKVKDRIEVNVVSYPSPDRVQTICVGVKCLEKSKLKLGDIVTIEHQGILDSGSLRHPVYKGKV